MQAPLFAITATLLLFGASARAQTRSAPTKVASYSYGTPGTVSYEHLSFWAKAGKRTDIFYSYGPDRKEVTVKYLGKTQLNGEPGFKVRFANGNVLSVIPKGTLLAVSAAGQTPNNFAWEYEGPVNGVGTFCDVCVADEKEAVQFMQTYYLK
ncbi:hypothetical protein [Hymenobacter negativus]|uniref:Uncharacterized protein n=1 Tax=Hymenobacter negativus TaxID=2795026 RepID=A0ABS0Q3U4_9BACT|nr:hypothetical protein [Hymenobacter negativus]MBH8557237.1 hypothetical protein [Hymenobacter negativus]